MPIFDQGYQHWQGKLSGHAWRWLTITRQGVRAQMTNRLTRLTMLAAWVPAITLTSWLILWGLFEQKSSLVTPVMGIFRALLPAEIQTDPRAYRATVWTIAYQYFFQVQLFFSMILVLLVGPNLISQDLRFNAIPLYFSRPLRRFDYFVGKLGVIAVFLGAVAIVPAVIAYMLGFFFSLDLSVIKDTGRLLGASIAYGLVVVLSAGTLMLAISSLSRNSRYVAAIWFGFWLISGATAGVLGTTARVEEARARAEAERQRAGAAQADDANSQQAEVERQRGQWYPLVSYTGNLQRIGVALLDTWSAWQQLDDLMEAGQRGMAAARASPFGRPPGGRPVPPQRLGPRLTEQAGASYPWSWSAGVLAGLFGLSLWILTSRVKSLDRLR